MPSTSSIKFKDGKRWAVGSQIVPRGYDLYGVSSYIIIPTNQIDGLSDTEIGGRVRELQGWAILEAVEENANHWLGYSEGLSWPWDTELKAWREFKRYRDESQQIEAAFVSLSLTRMKRRRGRWLDRSDRPRLIRNQVKADYSGYLAAVTKRDGYECAACGTTDDLQIDHIQAVSNGGNNDLDNLQLLCPTCNSAKGTQTIDYRDKEESD